MNNLFIFVGGSASGKTTIEEAWIKKGFGRLVVDTTRTPREGEIDGVHYNFISVENFNKNDYMEEIIITPDWKYGTSVSELNRLASLETDSIYSVINIEPAVNLKRFIEANNIGLNVHIIAFNLPVEVRIALMEKRGDSPEAIKKRLANEDAFSKWEELNCSPDLVVESLETSFKEISEYINKVQTESLTKYSDNSLYYFKGEGKKVEEVIEGLKQDGLWE